MCHYGLDPEDYETNILLADGIAWFESEGSIRMAEGLGLPWSLARLLRILPLRLADRLYRCLARNRLRLFGRRANLLPRRARPRSPVPRVSPLHHRILIVGGYGAFGGRLALLWPTSHG